MKRLLLRRKDKRLRWGWVTVVMCSLLVTGCSAADMPPWLVDLQQLISPLPSPTAAPPPTATPAPTATPEPTPTLSSSAQTLRLWVPDFLAPEAIPGQLPEEGEIAALSEQITAFNRMTSGPRVEIQVKKATGVGGLYDLLSTASDVAPSIVPDLLVLNRQDLHSAVGEGLVLPLDDHLPPDAGYFPAALDAMRTPEGLWAFPYVATAEQMAYRTTVTITPPITWTAVLSHSFSIALPGAPPDAVGTDMLLAMYIGAGGRVVDTTGQVTLNRAVLEQVYAFLLDAQDAGLLDAEQALALTDTAACWDLYQQTALGLTPVSVGSYWQAHMNTFGDAATPTPPPEATDAEEEAEVAVPVQLPEETLPTWVPTASGQPITVMRTWGLAIVAQEPARREAALELLRWLVSAQQMGDLTRAVGLTPTRTQAVLSWDLDAESMDFVLDLLSNGVAAPSAGIDVVVRRALQAGLTAILLGEATTPDAAASQALTSLRR
jgi:ABC-type glycerol-3-phosphate transport system substrate-binding protein